MGLPNLTFMWDCLNNDQNNQLKHQLFSLSKRMYMKWLFFKKLSFCKNLKSSLNYLHMSQKFHLRGRIATAGPVSTETPQMLGSYSTNRWALLQFFATNEFSRYVLDPSVSGWVCPDSRNKQSSKQKVLVEAFKEMTGVVGGKWMLLTMCFTHLQPVLECLRLVPTLIPTHLPVNVPGRQ